MRLVYAACLAVMVCGYLEAQEQVVNVTGFAAAITDQDTTTDQKTVCGPTDLATVANIDDGDIDSLRQLVSYATKQKGIAFSGEDTAVIHLAIWNKQSLTNQIWFVVTADGRWLKQNAVDTRVFSKHSVILVYVHKGLTLADTIQYKLTAKKKTPDNIEHVIQLVKAFLGGTLAPQAPTVSICSWNAQSIALNAVPSTLTFQSFVKPTSKAPTAPPITATLVGTNLTDINVKRSDANIVNIRLCRSGACSDPIALSAGEVTIPAAACSGATCTISGLNSKGDSLGSVTLGGTQPQLISPAGGVPAVGGQTTTEKIDAPEIGNKQYTNETLPCWDVSLMLQVKKVSDLQFNSSDNTVTTAKVDKQNLFVLGDFFPLRHWERNWRIKGEFISFPLSFGIPISKTPLDRPFIGGGAGTRKFQFMAGVTFESLQKPTTLGVGSTATASQLSSNLASVRTPTLFLGLNVSVSQIVTAMSKK